MTNQQKSIIQKLRSSGKSYSDISNYTGIPIGTVKAFCSRNMLKSYQDKPLFCEFCGEALIQTPNHRPKRFCCDTCRHRWWGNNRVHQIHKGTVRVCSQCSAQYASYRGSSKFCSHPCYIAHRFGKEVANHDA